MGEPLVSIITPTYNSEKYITKTINSVEKQTYKYWEMIVVDDKSRDDTRNIVHEHAKKDKRIKLLINKVNRGPAFSRNRTIKYASGKYIAFLDSDDLWTANKLEIQLEFMTLNKIDFTYSMYNIVREDKLNSKLFIPRLWAYGHIDWKYIKSIHKEFGRTKLSTFPHFTLTKFLWYTIARRIRMISILNYMDYNKDEAMKVLTQELKWGYYGGKHYESVYTRFYQSYILPKKFNIDKRKAHLSCLILSKGDMSRDHALDILKQPPANTKLMEEDKEYVIKKLGITVREFEEIMNIPVKSINDYRNNYFFEKGFRKLLHQLRRLNILPN